MEPDELIDTASRVADFEAVNWQSLEQAASSDANRRLIHELSALARIAGAHRQLHDMLGRGAVDGDRAPSARWDHLELLEPIGKGTSGTVYRALDTRLHREVALKLYPPSADVLRVIEEGRRLARVHHPNVVLVFGADIFEGVPGLWMELIRGRSLDAAVRENGPFGADEASVIGRDLARALAALHSAGLVHRDVKAQNVVRESGGRVVLMDLGASSSPVGVSPKADSRLVGTPLYMAPEMLEGAPATVQSDLYALGVLLFFLTTGTTPINAVSLEELRRAHRARHQRRLVDARPSISPRFSEVVSSLLEADPAERPRSAGEVEERLAAAVGSSQRSTAGRFKGRAAVAAVAVLVAVSLWTLVPRSPGPAPQSGAPIRLAVMPIRNLTGDPSKDYLAQGLTELLVAQLARLKGLQIPASEGLASFRDKADTEAIAGARRAGARLMLAGSVVQADARVHLNVRLTDLETLQVLWGSEIVREAEDIVGARSEVAQQVAARLSLDVADGDQRLLVERPRKPEAQEAFVRGLVESNAGPDGRVAPSVAFFRAALDAEPDWAEPLGYLALATLREAEGGDPSERASRADDVRALALRAIQIDPGVPVGYVALAAVQGYFDWDFAAAEANLRRALEIVPNDGFVHMRLGLLLAAMGRLDEAVAEATRARDLDPLVPVRHTTLGIIQYYARQYDAALTSMQRAIEINPTYGAAYFGRGRIYSAMGRHADAIRETQLALAQSRNVGWLVGLAIVYAAAGQVSETEDTLAELQQMAEQSGQFGSPDNFGYIAGYQQRHDEAFQRFDEAVRNRMTNILWIGADPRADPVRADPRMRELLGRIGLTP